MPNRVQLLVLFFIICVCACVKQVDYSEDINSLKQEISTIKLRLDSLSNAIKTISNSLTNLEASQKTKISESNSRIDSVSTALKATNASNTQNFIGIAASIKTLTDNIAALGGSFSSMEAGVKNRFDSINKRIDSSYLLIQKATSDLSDSVNAKIILINDNYNTILNNYLNLLKIISATPQVTRLSGIVFKGGFLRGSLLNFYELDSMLNQTGRSFNSTIEDNYGNFELNAQNLKGKFVRVIGDGFYWNEVLNENSATRISLTGICRVDSNETVNVNVLTHLERQRVEYLYKTLGLSFDSAKTRAVQEVLAAFGYTNTTIKKAEKVSLFGVGDDSKILLAISVLIQGYRSESETTQILNDIGEDLKKDGTLNATTLGNDLKTHLNYVDTAAVLNNVKTRYSRIYNSDTIQTLNMEFIKPFANNTSYTSSGWLMEFPALGNEFALPNVLNDTVTTYSSTIELKCITKRKGLNLKIVLSDENGNALPSIGPNCAFGVNIGSSVGWTLTNNCGLITLQTTGVETNNQYLIVRTDGIKKIKVTFYEHGTTTPTRSKLLTYKP
jgi:hypothetical protein